MGGAADRTSKCDRQTQGVSTAVHLFLPCSAFGLKPSSSREAAAIAACA
jgi:hypothetical protein